MKVSWTVVTLGHFSRSSSAHTAVVASSSLKLKTTLRTSCTTAVHKIAVENEPIIFPNAF